MSADLPSSRRGFLRGLTTLPLIGGSVALIGAPSAVAEPVTDALLGEYADWLVYEHGSLMRELHGQDNPRAASEWQPRFGRAFDWQRARGPFRKSTPDGQTIGDGVSFPSMRAALVLSTVGCNWREGF